MDFAVIAQRIKEQFCKPDTEEAANTALSYMVNGEYFSDIDYSSGAPAGWPLLAHLTLRRRAVRLLFIFTEQQTLPRRIG